MVMTERYRSGQPLHHPSDVAFLGRRHEIAQTDQPAVLALNNNGEVSGEV